MKKQPSAFSPQPDAKRTGDGTASYFELRPRNPLCFQSQVAPPAIRQSAISVAPAWTHPSAMSPALTHAYACCPAIRRAIPIKMEMIAINTGRAFNVYSFSIAGLIKLKKGYTRMTPETQDDFGVFAPPDLEQRARESGLYQCPTCGLIWPSYHDNSQCVYSHHQRPVHVVILDRNLDRAVSIGNIVMPTIL